MFRGSCACVSGGRERDEATRIENSVTWCFLFKNWAKNANTSVLPTAWAWGRQNNKWFSFQNVKVISLTRVVCALNPPLEVPSVRRSLVWSGRLQQGSRSPGPPGHWWMPGWHTGNDRVITVENISFINTIKQTLGKQAGGINKPF